MTTEIYKLILVTHRQAQPLDAYLQFIEKCVTSGVSSVQLREKDASPFFLLDYASRLKKLLDQYQIPLIINDNLELALEIDAHGVHLGQTDGSPALARARLGPDKCIGLSIESEDDLTRANACEVDYVAASAVFPSSHKTNLRTIWGLDGLQSLAKRSIHPLIAIGGINQQNLGKVMAAGAQGVAVIGALHEADNPAAMAAELRSFVDRSKNNEPG
ncbi:Thiamine-phosphate synthase [Legionella massiliensis]|uniref:Thiamine-phosphate synthase n=1 Tax=Legionella massiliensis TaxID=1034943 RepID=A0A078KYJ3_9GAMM|nr:thiamine phosphate synthase [Legionella massiliensis]CDZ77996.1 Thiamine-phosphate synthase [Legionella massiliensis]CEE13734.1 Thiamine-phosphate synthase [Legionella massiliensis]